MPPHSYLQNSFVLAYALASVLLCLVIYKARWFARFDWHAPHMNKVAGTGVIHQVDINSGDTARNAAVAALNVTNNLSPANGAALFVLGFFLAGCFMGGVAFPAALGLVPSITTLNLASLLIAGLAWGFSLGRLTRSLVALVIKAVLGLALIAVLLFAGNFVLSFLAGGKDVFWNGTVAAVTGITDSVYNYDRAPQGSWFYRYENRRKFNLCALYEGIRTKGDIQQVRAQCDRAAYLADLKAMQDAATQQLQQQQNENNAFRQRFLAVIDRLSAGVPRAVVPNYAKTPHGSWQGQPKCSDGNATSPTYLITFSGEGTHLSGAVLVLPKSGTLDASKIASYRFTGAQEGMEITLHASDWIQERSEIPKQDMQFTLHPYGISLLSTDMDINGCKGMVMHGWTPAI